VGRFPGRGFFGLSQNRGRNCPRFFVFGVLKQMNQNQDEIKPQSTGRTQKEKNSRKSLGPLRVLRGGNHSSSKG
jgi:hypothetical protein